MTGKIRWFNKERGFGFIDGVDGVVAFVHISNVENQEYPVEGQEVSYETRQTSKGIEAVNVTFVKEVSEDEKEEA